jgi:predicted transcriptional regulator
MMNDARATVNSARLEFAIVPRQRGGMSRSDSAGAGHIAVAMVQFLVGLVLAVPLGAFTLVTGYGVAVTLLFGTPDPNIAGAILGAGVLLVLTGSLAGLGIGLVISGIARLRRD